MTFVPETPPPRSLAGIGRGACREVGRCVNVARSDWIKLHARGRVLDIGMNEGSGWTVPMDDVTDPGPVRWWDGMKKSGQWFSFPMPTAIDSITGLDCDAWKGIFPLVRGDAHRLPFRDESFDTVVLGDILEHVVDDYRVLAEALRVACQQVIATTPDEYGWDPELNPFKPIEEWIHEYGDDYGRLQESETTGLRTDYATCEEWVRDEQVLHLHHVRWYDYGKVTNLLKSTGRPYALEHIHYHGNPPKFTNFAVVIAKS